MPRGALSDVFAPAIVLLVAGGAMPGMVLAQANAHALSPPMKQLLDSARVWQAKNRPDMARGIAVEQS